MNKFGKAVLFLSTASLALMLMLILTVPALAEVVDGNPNAIINEDINDDLFVAGKTVEVNSTIKGDVYAAGQDVIINGVIEGNLIMTGQFLELNGEIHGSVIAGGFDLRVNKDAVVDGSLYYGGYTLLVQEGALIKRSQYTGGYQAEINGQIKKNSVFSGAAYTLNGIVGGDVQVDLDYIEGSSSVYMPMWFPFMPGGIDLDSIEPGLYIGENAEVGGEVLPKVTSLDIEIPDVPGITIQPPELIESDIRDGGRGMIFSADFNLGYRILDTVRKFIGETIAFTLIGLAFIFWKRDLLDKAADTLNTKLLPGLGWSLVVLVLSPFVIMFVALLLVVVGVLLSLITLGTLTSEFVGLTAAVFGFTVGVFSLAVWFLSKIAVSFWVGKKLVDMMLPKVKDNRWGYFWAVLFGAVIYGFLRAIPFLGGLTAFIVILIGFGAIVMMVKEVLVKPKKVKA